MLDEKTIDEALLSLRKNNSGISSGFKDLDQLLGGGFQDRYLYVLGGRPAIGKTPLAISIARNICQKRKKVLYINLGLRTSDLVKRFILCESMGEQKYYEDAANELKNYFLTLNGVVEDIDYLGNFINDDLEIDHVDFIVIDYLQLLDACVDQQDESPDFNYEKRIYISKKLKELAWRKNVPVLVLSQLSRKLEERPSECRRPIIADLYEYDKVAELADVVMFLYRDEYYNPDTEAKNIAELHVAKNSTGITGKIRLASIECKRFVAIPY